MINRKSKEEKIKTKKLAAKLKNYETNHNLTADLLKEFSQIYRENIINILQGEIVGKHIQHIFEIEKKNYKFDGTVIGYKNNIYEITYYSEISDEEECIFTKYEIGADYLNKDLYIVE